MDVLKISKLSKSYDLKPIFSNLNAEFYKGITYIRGESGCGKTTLMRIISGLEKADSGIINGITGNITYLFQEPRLLPHFNVIDNICAISKNRSSCEAKAEKMLLYLGFSVEDFAKKPSVLSGGMMQKVSFVRAMIYMEEFGGNTIILDEPFKGLDDSSKDKIATIIDKIQDKIILVVAHETADIDIHRGKTVYFSDLI